MKQKLCPGVPAMTTIISLSLRRDSDCTNFHSGKQIYSQNSTESQLCAIVCIVSHGKREPVTAGKVGDKAVGFAKQSTMLL